jgi:hypothetical protein
MREPQALNTFSYRVLGPKREEKVFPAQIGQIAKTAQTFDAGGKKKTSRSSVLRPLMTWQQQGALTS